MPMPNNPVVIVTGASRGLGAASARWLAKAGAAVTLISRSGAALKGVAEEVQHCVNKTGALLMSAAERPLP